MVIDKLKIAKIFDILNQKIINFKSKDNHSKVHGDLRIYLHGTQYFSVSLTPSLLGSKIETIPQNLWNTV